MPVDLADNAAATAAGYARIQLDRGSGKSPRWQTTYEKHLVGEPGTSGAPWRADATSDVSQADADSKALTALNAQRRHRYGGSPGRASEAGNQSVGSHTGGAMTTDVH
jgi:hypothetical protein